MVSSRILGNELFTTARLSDELGKMASRSEREQVEVYMKNITYICGNVMMKP